MTKQARVDTVIPNTTLTVPNKVLNIHNNASTFKPYDAGEAIGDVNPTLPDPPPPQKDKGCGGFVKVLAIVVAVVVTVYTAGAAAGWLAPAANTLGAAAAGTTAGSMALGGAVMAGTATGISAGTAFAAAAIGGGGRGQHRQLRCADRGWRTTSGSRSTAAWRRRT